MEEKGSECTAPTINEETLQTAVVKAINELLANKEPFLSTLQKNIATVFNEENDNATDDIDGKLEELKSYQDEEDEEDEEADCLEYIDNTDKIIYLYYQDDKCVGKVKLRKNWNRYAYIEDIAVCKDFRGQGIGSALINISIEWAKHKNLHGLMLETQDNNLIACKFYHNCGFKIGSVDTMLYANFENNFEKAVFWYLRF